MNFKLVALIFFLFNFWGSNNELDIRSRENILDVIGTKIDSRQFKTFKEFWNLDRNFESRQEGIKLNVSSITGEVEGVSIAGENNPLNQSGFQKFSSTLPFG